MNEFTSGNIDMSDEWDVNFVSLQTSHLLRCGCTLCFIRLIKLISSYFIAAFPIEIQYGRSVSRSCGSFSDEGLAVRRCSRKSKQR